MLPITALIGAGRIHPMLLRAAGCNSVVAVHVAVTWLSHGHATRASTVKPALEHHTCPQRPVPKVLLNPINAVKLLFESRPLDIT
jgi:hypothetical protein